MTDEDKRRVAIHEAGHALVALSVPHADPVHRVTILPRSSGALGATLQLPETDRYLMTREELLDRVCVLLGGRAAELLLFDDLSTGSADDLQRATDLARQMVCRFGMSDRLGDVAVEAETSPFLGVANLSGNARYSEETARLIDEEVRGLLDAERERAWEILRSARQALERVVDRLLAEETVERATLEALIRNGREKGREEGGDERIPTH